MEASSNATLRLPRACPASRPTAPRPDAARKALTALAILLLACALATLCACGGGGDSGGSGSAGASGGQSAASSGGGGDSSAPSPSGGEPSGDSAPSAGGDAGEATGAAYTQPADVAVSVAGGPGIDTSHAAEGYVSASAESSARLKFQVTKDDISYNYDLPGDGTPTVFPINMGDGSYLLRIMQNTSESSYVEMEAATVDVTLNSEFGPFLVPSVFCNYSASSACVSKARELTSGAGNQGEVVRAICSYVAQNVTYDEAKAAELSTTTGYVPNPDSTLSSGKGVCFDYASLSAAMLRSMGIPTKIVTGYVGAEQLYHAWIMVYIDGSWQSVSFSVSPNTWSRCDVTFASAGATQYAGDGTSYADKYVY